MTKKVLLILFLICFANSVFAQKYYQMSEEEFGRSKVQYKDLQWKTIKSQNFEFNYYNGGEHYARKAAKIAESEFGRITETLGYVPFTPIKIFVYNSLDDLKQSNIVQNNFDEDDYISLSKARIQLPYQKSDSLFRSKLIYQISNLYVGDMLFGGSLKESMQNKILLSVPDWFSKGIAAYMVSNGKMNLNKIQTAIAKNNSLERLNKQDAELIGSSIWNYIAVRYGKDKISNVLNLTRIIRNEQSSITSTLNVPFSKFIKDWRDFYLNSNGIFNKPDTQIKVKTEEPKKIENGQPLKNLKPGEVDTDFYIFEPQNLDKFKIIQSLEIAKIDSAKQVSQDSKEEIKLTKPKAFQNYLIRSDLDIGLKMDPIRKFGFTGDMIFHDVLENNVITLSGFMRLSTSIFKNYDYSIEYARYKGRMDFKFKYTKRSIDLSSLNDTTRSTNYFYRPLNLKTIDYSVHRIYSQNISVMGIYPVSRSLKLDFGAAILKASDVDYTLPGNGVKSDTYFNPSFSAVFDNSRLIDGINEIGTKAKISIERNMAFKNDLLNFGRFNLDIRHYQKVAKGLVLAGRLSYGKSTGNSPKYTFIGGVENYLNRNVYHTDLLSSGTVGNYRDILFYNFDSNLRGFEFARLYGTNHMIFNIEARLFLANYLPQSSLNSSFLRNLQVVLFDDLGTAWNGSNGPFSKQNSLNNSTIEQSNSPFFATVTTFQNPFLMGFGAGIRTVILGLTVKGDYGIGRQNKVNNSGLFQLSFGKNF